VQLQDNQAFVYSFCLLYQINQLWRTQ
jgi:hypothetical protein